MNRSFVYGIVVASTTWCFSLYLYWLLTKNSSETSPGSLQWSPSGPDSPDIVVLKHKNLQNGPNQLGGFDEKQHKIQEQKDFLFKKYKKDKKFRKISQRLQDELKPVEVYGGDGKRIKFANSFIRIARCVMEKCVRFR